MERVSTTARSDPPTSSSTATIASTLANSTASNTHRPKSKLTTSKSINTLLQKNGNGLQKPRLPTRGALLFHLEVAPARSRALATSYLQHLMETVFLQKSTLSGPLREAHSKPSSLHPAHHPSYQLSEANTASSPTPPVPATNPLSPPQAPPPANPNPPATHPPPSPPPL